MQPGGINKKLIDGMIASRGDKFKGITFDKLAYSRSCRQYIIFLISDEKISIGNLNTLEKFIVSKLRKFDGVFKVIVRRPKEDIAKDADFAEVVKDMIVMNMPALAPHVVGCTVKRDGNSISMSFPREISPELMRRLGAVKLVEDYLLWTYGMEMKVRELKFEEAEVDPSELMRYSGFVINEEMQEPKRPQSSGPLPWEGAPAPRQEKPAPKPEKTEKKAPKPGSALLGKKIQEDSEDMMYIDADQDVTVEGEAFGVDLRLLRDGKFTVCSFALTDKKTSVPCKIFKRGDKTDELGCFKNGKRYKVRGKFAYDTFVKDNVIEVKDAVELLPLPEREDTSEEKRVELHVHTTMSAQDALNDPDKLVGRAAKWGHKAIAITDHGVVQAFPDAANAGKKYGVKIIFGMEAYLVDDSKCFYQGERDYSFDDEFVVFDIETTGLSPKNCGITEIGAVRVAGGELKDTFSTFVDPEMRIPPNIVSLTGITQDMVAGAPKTKEALEKFWEYVGDTKCLVAHNASFDTSFIFGKSNELGIEFKADVLDSVAVARAALPDIKSHKLNILAKHYKIPLKHHRAMNDAQATAKILLKMFADMREKGVETLRGMDSLIPKGKISKHARANHALLLCKNKTGLTNLYRLVSYSHLEHFYRRPRIPKSMLTKYREGLILGSACEQGELFRAVLAGKGDAELRRIASYYDYLEIQPRSNNMFLVREGTATEAQLEEYNRKIYNLGKSMGKRVVATTDSHYLDPEDAIFRTVLLDSLGFKDADTPTPLYFRTTDEMLEEFSYLGEDAAREVVITSPNEIAEMTDELELFPGETVMPVVDGDAEEIEELAYRRMRERYGAPLPELIGKRLDRELGSIIKHGFAVLYWIAYKLVKKSNDDGYLVGSRGSVGSSLAAYAMGITEVNPLPPHYLCEKCKHVDFDIDDRYTCGVDMPPAVCPVCGADMTADGYDIPFEVFLGFNADKVPDIDLNFSGEYQAKAHAYVEEVFGQGHVFRAGTISAMQDKTAAGIVRKYMEKRGRSAPAAEIDRLAQGMSGVKRTTGQHPGGMVIVPRDREVYEFTAIQKPADKIEGNSVTTHFDFNSMHDILIKLDILGHDNPTIIKMLQDLIGFDPLKIPLNDPETMSLFSSVKALGITPDQIRGIDVGTLGIPEFGTPFVRGMLKDTKPTTMEELIRISGLSHGTDVWLGNAKDLISEGVTNLKGVICTRDDIMNYLIKKGVDPLISFQTMESVRKGKWAKGKEKNREKQESAMREAGVEDWFIESCAKIAYMFPKAHAVAYVVMSLRIAYCKVHYPSEFYATYFTVRATEFDASVVAGGREGILKHMAELENSERKLSATEQNLITILEVALEMLARGIEFLPVDLKRSTGKKFTIEEGNLRIPFISIPKLGEKAAEKLEEEAKTPFLSVDEVRQRGKISSNVIESMRDMGCFAGMPESAQMTLFDDILQTG